MTNRRADLRIGSYQTASLYRVAEINLKPDPSTVGTGAYRGAHCDGLYTVVPQRRGSVSYAFSDLYCIDSIDLPWGPDVSIWSAGAVAGAHATVNIPPPVDRPAPDNLWPYPTYGRQARAHLYFAINRYGDWGSDPEGVVIDDPGCGYLTAPVVTVSSVPGGPGFPFTVTANLQAADEGGLLLDNANHGLAVDDKVVLQWGVRDGGPITPWNAYLFRSRVNVTSVNKNKVTFAGGFPNTDYNPGIDPGGGSALAQACYWGIPGIIDSTVLGNPPWKIAVMRQDPEPVYYMQRGYAGESAARGVGPLSPGQSVVVYETIRKRVYSLALSQWFSARVAQPINLMTRLPWWGGLSSGH